jgi:hypothetical protein
MSLGRQGDTSERELTVILSAAKNLDARQL